MSTLVATLGQTWQVIPEIAAALAPQRCALYARRPHPFALDDSGAVPQAIWVIASGDSDSQRERIRQWNQALSQPFQLRFFVAEDTHSVSSSAEVLRLRELIHRVVLLASERGPLWCSLAGGRKTMSADVQRAASLFGCRCLLHVVAPDPMPAELRSDDAAFWAVPLSAEVADCVEVLSLGGDTRNEVLDTLPPLCSADYPLPEEQEPGVVFFADQPRLCDELQRRLADARQLLHNYLGQLGQSESSDNWRQLYRLPPRDLERLRNTPILDHHEALLRKLPKAELHCHLGGLPSVADQRRIGRAVWDALEPSERQDAQQRLHPWLEDQSWPTDWPAKLRAGPRTALAAALLVHASDAVLQYNLYTATEPRIALKTRAGFAAYEQPGELSGSALLTHPAALAPYADAVRAYAVRENLRYLELRGSPHKYDPLDPLVWLARLRRALPDDAQCRYRFIWIADRRQPERMAGIARWAVQAQECLTDFFVGIDLAGDEGTAQPEQLARDFERALRACIPITIHAGEGESAENIWHAAYALNADRIGHGLTLVEDPRLLARFRNRGICLELCPSSNREVVGFHDTRDTRTDGLPAYPLRAFLEQGVAVTLNSDNPGISRTGLSTEFSVAARMGSLSWWEALSMTRAAFAHAFIDAAERSRLLNAVDLETQEVVRALLPRLAVESFPQATAPSVIRHTQPHSQGNRS